MIAPLYGGHSAHDVLQMLLDNPQASVFDAVQATAKTYIKGDFDSGWRRALHNGWVEGTAFTPKPGPTNIALPAANNAMPLPSSMKGTNGVAYIPAKTEIPLPADTLQIAFRPDPSLYDGRFANVGWLQELPKQITNLSWDNAALMSLATMEGLKLEQNDAVEIEAFGRKVIAPALMVPGHPDGSITVHLGFGRRAEAGRVGAGVGFNAYLLRTSDHQHTIRGKLTRTGGTYDICVTKVDTIEHRGSFAQQDLNTKESDKQGTYSLPGHEAMERAIIRYATLAEVKANPNFAHENEGECRAR